MQAVASNAPAGTRAKLVSQVHGPFNTKSLHGLRMDELKSGLQKYARRGDPDSKGMWCLRESMLLGMASFCEGATMGVITTVKGICTNFARRIVICGVEDCLEPGMLQPLADAYDSWTVDRDSSHGMAALQRMYSLVTSARKGRVVSIVKLYVNRSEQSSAWRAKWGHLVNPPAGRTFDQLLADSDLRCASLLEAERAGPRGDAGVWTRLRNVAPQAAPALTALRQLRTLYGGGKESEYFLYLGLYLAVHRNRLSATDAWHTPAIPDITPDSVVAAYSSHLTAPTIELDDFCLDMHTKAGKLRGMGPVQFAKEGALVTNVNGVMLPPDDQRTLGQMYLDSKLMPPGAADKAPPPTPADKAPTHAAGVKRKGDELPAGPSAARQKTATGAQHHHQQQLVPYFGGQAALRAALMKAPEYALPPGVSAVPLLPNTCGAKPMTYRVGDKVLKPTTTVDAVLVDACKPLFRLARTGVSLVRAKLRSVCERGEDKQQRHRLTPADDWQAFLLMDLVTAAGGGGDPAPMVSATDKRAALGSREALEEFLKIALFRAVFRVSDFNTRNVLVGGGGRLYSIDENGAGTCPHVFAWKPAELRDAVRRHKGALEAAHRSVAHVVNNRATELRGVLDRTWKSLGIGGGTQLDVGWLMAKIHTDTLHLLERAQSELGM